MPPMNRQDTLPPIANILPGASELSTKGTDLLLVESIDQGLCDLLGRRARETIYDYLERRCYMSRDEIPGRLEEFCGILQANFGKGGLTIQKTIAKRFYSRLEKRFIDYPGYTLADYVKNVTKPANASALDLPITTTTITTYFVSNPGNEG